MKIDTSKIREALSDASDTAKRSGDARQYRCLRSRGTLLCTSDEGGDQCDPYPAGGHPVWRGTAKEIVEAIELVTTDERYKNVEEIYIERGFDGADSPWGLNNDQYDPWIACVNITVWTRKDGINPLFKKDEHGPQPETQH